MKKIYAILITIIVVAAVVYSISQFYGDYNTVHEGNNNMNYCTNESRNVAACEKIYKPVCGWNDPAKIQCIRYPCAMVYSNSCLACQNAQVIAWSEGKCPA